MYYINESSLADCEIKLTFRHIQFGRNHRDERTNNVYFELQVSVSYVFKYSILLQAGSGQPLPRF